MENNKEKDPEILAKEVSRRNYFLKRFFIENEVSITLMGDYNNPLIVLDDNIVLSCHVHNFELIFKDNTHNGNEKFRIKLKSRPPIMKGKLQQWINDAKHRKVYLFKANGYYFAKYVKVLNSQRPLFTPSKDLAYYVFNRQRAIEVNETLKLTEPKIEIVY